MCLVKSPSRRHRAVGGLPSRLATLPDPRDRRGRRHPFVSVLLVACSAVMCGARSFAAIGQWARNAPQDTLARLGARTVSAFTVRTAPSTATIRCTRGASTPPGLRSGVHVFARHALVGRPGRQAVAPVREARRPPWPATVTAAGSHLP
ncbi:transposase family protein [Streptomyces sp. NBC_01483]|uniref:transposase family protein n=1 Tax=Streptomyces sp. NBC_01483 TaxID=2903883 RepID=UPI002E3730EE|nr:transposase family protein [Streptomyces sp. NBC_01483]